MQHLKFYYSKYAAKFKIILAYCVPYTKPVAQRHQMVSSTLALLTYSFPILMDFSFLYSSREVASVGDEVL